MPSIRPFEIPRATFLLQIWFPQKAIQDCLYDGTMRKRKAETQEQKTSINYLQPYSTVHTRRSGDELVAFVRSFVRATRKQKKYRSNKGKNKTQRQATEHSLTFQSEQEQEQEQEQ